MGDITQADLEAENKALREFYDSWVFFHSTCSIKSDMGEKWEDTRRKMAAHSLAEAAKKVAELWAP